MTVTGHTRVFAIIADPVHHVRTPQALNALFTARGYDGIVVPAAVPASGLKHAAAALRAFGNWGGFIVTVPHKTEMPAFCDRLTPRAQAAGAVNVIRREADGSLTGELLDGVGFVRGLANAGHDAKGRSVYLAGAGGAASAIAFALAEAGVARLTVVNRSSEKAGQLVARLKEHFPAGMFVSQGTPAGHDIIVNGTSLGLKEGDALPVDPQYLRPEMLVAEVIMSPEATPLLQIAKDSGCFIHPGKAMLDGQLTEMFDFFTR
ncbi:shikimate dehydrogenase [Brucella sp. 10RB9215]|uniref:shikimate dehydrogenase family protein n=1 Tax=Brucella sp. 10RB9215 TaxID=1149953 RepID=UPI00090C2333|nr:shikimate dehydrogenase [Brucella sp. 10RB9215]SBW16337.1 shikimate dehydrogenase [Brucella sp. 10RB9215]